MVGERRYKCDFCRSGDEVTIKRIKRISDISKRLWEK